MKRIILLPLALTFAANTAIAANSVDLRVTGTITPAACNISMTGGGDFDLGSIPAQDLNQTTETRKDVTGKTLNINCSGPTLVGFTLHDNRPDSVPGPNRGLGLGFDSSGNQIGRWSLNLRTPLTVDGSAALVTRSDDNGATWYAVDNTAWPINTDTYNALASFAIIGTGDSPSPIVNASAAAYINAYINPSNNLNTSEEIIVDGSATIELVYL